MVQDLLRGAYLTTQDSTIDNQIAAYFDIVTEQSLSLQSQITDNWLEDNTPVNDHIANNPLTISLSGLSGELVYESPLDTTFAAYAKVNGFIQGKTSNSSFLQNKLNITTGNAINPYLKTEKLLPLASLYPPVDNVTQLAKNVVSYAESSVKRYVKIFKNLTNNTLKQTRLEKIYKSLALLRYSKEPLIVHTPYDTFTDMYIQSLILRQNNQNYITDVEISLKQLHFSNSQTTVVNSQNRSSCNFVQRETVENHGLVQGLSKTDGGNGNSDDSIFKLTAVYEDYK